VNFPEKTGLSGQKHVAPQILRNERNDLKIRVRLQLEGKELSGYTEDISPEGLLLISDTALSTGTSLALQCSFGEVCYLNISGQVVCCQAKDDGNHSVDIKFSALRDWEQNILSSVVQELKKSVTTQQKSLLTIIVSRDVLAQEAATLTPHPHTSTQSIKGLKGRRKFSPEPAWVLGLNSHIEPYRKAILECRLVQEGSTGTLSLTRMRAWITQLYPFIETFPKWIALNIAKTHDPVSRGFMIDNVRVEKKHAEQWTHMAEGFGITQEELYSVEPLPGVEALTHCLWSINTQGTLAEAVGATNYAIEGVTQDIAKLMIKGFPHYEGIEGVHLGKRSYWWAEAHARYDDLHPQQALEIMKLYTTTKDLEEKVKFATRRSLEYLLMALETCYIHFQTQEVQKTFSERAMVSQTPDPKAVG
jgi:pyrroloquinoline quinone (PQQ) biosynthesis protein C